MELPQHTSMAPAGTDPESWDRWQEAYALDVGSTMAKRLALAAAIYFLSVVAFATLELIQHSERARLVGVRLAIETVTCLSLIAWSRRLSPAQSPIVAAGFSAALTLLGSAYSAAGGVEATRFANGAILMLSALAVIFPWGWRAQLFVGSVAFSGFLASLPYMDGNHLSYSLLAFGIGVATSTFGAAFVARHRYEGFIYARRERQEAEIATSLVRVGETLSTQLGHGDMLDRVNLLAAEALGCDASAIFVWDAERQCFLLRSAVGLNDAQALVELREGGFGREVLPIERASLAGGAIEVAHPAQESPAIAGLLRRCGGASALVAPMIRPEGVVGVLIGSWRSYRESFSSAQRRIAIGIAQATAIALENARLIEELQTASRLRSEFVSTMSHELRTPLNVILGFNEMARDPTLDARERDEVLARVDAASRDLLTLVEDTLELGRIESGRDDVRPESVAFPAFWADLGAGMARLPSKQGVVLVWSEEAPQVCLVTDPRKLSVVVRNLAGNALKFTERGWVRVDAALTGAILEVTVADSGVGIAPEAQSVVFEMFRQVDGSDSRQHGGVGLGLHIVRRFVQQLGGTIELRSELGVGSTFTVRLPITSAPLARGVSAPPDPGIARTASATDAAGR